MDSGVDGGGRHRLDGKVAVVTGGGSGIGAAICLAFAAEGARVAVLDLDAEAASRTAKSAGQDAGRAAAHGCDVSDEAQVAAAFAAVDADLGPVEVLVNNAGIARARPEVMQRAMAALRARLSGQAPEPVRATSTLEVADFERMLAVHVLGSFTCTREALRRMEDRRSGVILNMASVAGVLGMPTAVHYAAAKGAIIAMTKSLSGELAAVGIRVNAIAPGWIDTPLLDQLDPQLLQVALTQVGMQRRGRPEEVAALAVHLCSAEASYTTGQVVSPNGGIPM